MDVIVMWFMIDANVNVKADRMRFAILVDQSLSKALPWRKQKAQIFIFLFS